ncbi:sensor histidine kinase [Polaribacter reichenbachii]|uniref:histidine kinase n=1 Tax=Polaribacter reichenbachii TaxID=996801 RepID=A0A1B8U5D8_9FLAO|nr:ATP-binding protein [Polaribacter reichenbachii]APZ47577.1 sensor histidine kinase [Polaribacter reichenbachii]AUC18217.1 sensor histidine kinase [Polaribacter reichenbachii]OBY67070.1 histidine kinase [Polaribacter reichenbachii]
MNSLLKRQIRKYLPKELQSSKDLEAFLDAVNRSYITSEDQFVMLQRAASISSEELFQSNQKLKKESLAQREIISKLNNVINNLKFYELDDVKNHDALDSLKLVDFIDNQTKEIIEINKQKDKLVASLEQQNQELNDYAHMVSHDLKSPLQSIDALTSWIKEDYYENLGEGGREIVNLIKENVEKMDTLIKGILEYSTIGNLEKKRYKVDLNSLIDDLILTLDNPNDIEIYIPVDLPSIYGDQHRLELLFYHLISNAVNFNDKGEYGVVEILFSDEGNYWKFKVRDNGKGIEKHYFETIFIAFQKLENDYKSTGIGLSIVKKIVEAYNGKISLESIAGKGTTFIFTLKK